jgi:hypothetical protein
MTHCREESNRAAVEEISREAEEAERSQEAEQDISLEEKLSQETEEAARSQETEEEQPEEGQPEEGQPEIHTFQRRLPTRGHKDTAEVDTLLTTPFETRVADEPTAFCKSLDFRLYPPKGVSLTITCTPQ